MSMFVGEDDGISGVKRVTMRARKIHLAMVI